MVERRKLRSNLPQEAISLLLSTAAAQSGALAAVLSDEEGLLLGGAGEHHDLEHLAALGVEHARRGTGAPDDLQEGLLEALVGAEDLYASPIQIGDDVVYLTSLGARVRRHCDIAAGLSRIFGAFCTELGDDHPFHAVAAG